MTQIDAQTRPIDTTGPAKVAEIAPPLWSAQSARVHIESTAKSGRLMIGPSSTLWAVRGLLPTRYEPFTRRNSERIAPLVLRVTRVPPNPVKAKIVLVAEFR